VKSHLGIGRGNVGHIFPDYNSLTGVVTSCAALILANNITLLLQGLRDVRMSNYLEGVGGLRCPALFKF
jgi:hypothetical protein